MDNANQSEYKFGQTTSPRLAIWILMLSGLLIFVALGLKTSHLNEINLDCALLLQLAKALLDGRELYVGIVEFNMPFPIWAHAIPLLLARNFDAPVIPVFHIVVTALALLSLVSCWQVVKEAENEKNSGLAFLLSLSIFQIIAGYDFGQREHLFVLLAAPYLLLRSYRSIGNNFSMPLSTYVGLLAGLGLTAKPHFLLPFGLFELAIFLCSRRISMFWKPEVFAAAAGLSLEVLYFLSMSTAAKGNYFQFLVPLASAGYKAMNSPFMVVATMHNARLLSVIAMIASLLIVPLRKNCCLLIPMFFWIFGAYLEFVLQTKNWSYHLLPFIFGTTVLVTSEVFIFVDAISIGFAAKEQKVPDFLTIMLRATQFFLVGVVIANCALAYPSIKANVAVTASDPLARIEEILRKETKPGDHVVVLDSEDSMSEQLLHLDLKPGCRYASVWPFILFEGRNLPAAEVTALEKKIVMQINEDVGRYKPTVIVINTAHPKFTPADFFLEQKLHKFGFYDGELQQYKLVETLSNYQIWKRNLPS